MAGVKQFNQADVLEQAMQVFWQQGYEATSIRDLTAATGLGRGSLYGAFGDKEGLFLAVLDHYEQSVQAQLGECLQNPDPKVALASLFEQMVTRMGTGAYPAGCLNTNTTLECSSRSDRINRTIAERLGKIESSIYEVLLRAQTQGSLPIGLDIRALSRFFLAISQGIAVLNKAFADPSVIKDVAKVTNTIWDDMYQDQ